MDDINFDNDLLNLDLDSLFGEGDDYHDYSYSLAANLTDIGFGSSNAGGNDHNGDAARLLSSLQSDTSRRSSSTSATNNEDAPPQLVVSKLDGTCIYRSTRAGNTVGIKLLNQNVDRLNQASENSSQEMNLSIKKLVHEETVFKLLPPHVRKRQVIEVSSFNGSPALYFKWENGITCEEWLDKVRNQQRTKSQQKATTLTVHLRAAIAIAKTLTQFHQSRVVYNSLTLDNIVLTPFEGDYLATFIDLSDAAICNDEQAFDERKRVDLMNLGIVLNQLFRTDGGGGESSAANSGRSGGGELTSSVSTDSRGGVPSNTNTRNARKRGKKLTPGEGIPLYLRAMVSTLIGGNNAEENASQMRYESANAVFEDLKVLTTQATNSDRRNNFFKETEVDHEVIINNRLKLPKDLFYGRQVQKSMLTHLLQSATMLGDQPLMALIAGYPGTGKSTLVNQIKQPLADKNGLFIEGKFDNISARPDKVLASAIDAFFADIITSRAGENAYMSMRWRISDVLGSGVSCLYGSIPSLRTFMDDETEVVRSERRAIAGNLLDQRLKYMYCKLISAISCRSQPLVLVLDDLQWADEMTLGVIRMLMTDPDIHHFLFLGCYRENEVNESHMLSTNLNDIREQGINVVTIKVGAIEKESTNALLSDIMCLPPNLCRPLSNTVHRKTGGIIMFILRLLASLNDEGLIWYSIKLRRWMFDLQKIELKEMSEDVVKHMTEHMSRLPGQKQLGLRLCACLGPTFDAMILEKACKNADIGDNFLASCVEDGYLLTEGGSSYKWSHDQVQQAAYGLIPLQMREKVHLLVGSRLLMSTPPSEMERFIFHVTDNLNNGANLLDNIEQKRDVAELNLRAGEKVLQQQSYHSAVRYLMTGISLLGDDDSWEANYRLSLSLYDAASEALCVVGDYPTLTALAEKPLHYALCFEDKLITYSNLVRALSSSGKNDECINTCVSVLSELGESIPTTITQEIYVEEVAKVREALIGRSRQDLLSLPVMTDIKKLTTMRFLNHMLLVTYASSPPLNPIVVFRMVRLTVAYGVCNIAPIAFSCYGGWLASSLNEDYDAAFTIGRVASDLMIKMGCVEILPRVHAVVYGMINIYKEPWQASLCKHSEAFDVGLNVGDMEYAVSNIIFYHTLALFGSGSNLLESNQSLHKHIQRGVQYNQLVAVKTLSVLEQMTYDLMGLEKNAYNSNFGGLNEDAVIDFAIKNKFSNLLRVIYQKTRYVKYMCGDMDAAAKHYDLQQELYANCAGHAATGRTMFFSITTFIDGLIGLYFARKDRDDKAKWTSVAEVAIALMSKWAKSCSWNFANKLSLLQAEYFFLNDDERAYSCYKASIKQAREHRFNHEEGLAHEKLATYLLHKNKHDEALQHFQNAKKCYAIWHATVLVQRVEKAIAVLSPLCGSSS